MSKDQARKSRDSKRRKVWVIKDKDGREYEAFVHEKCDAIAIARKNGLSNFKVYKTREIWSK